MKTIYFQLYCWIILGHGCLYFALFANFYGKAYRNKKHSEKQTKIE